MNSYFEIFGLPENLQVDSDSLQKRFYQLSRENHPDRFARAAPDELARAMDLTSALNDGYRVLRDPVHRAEYVLKRAGFDIGEQRSKDVPAELLEEVFELNMQLDELRAGDEDARAALIESRAKFAAMLEESDIELAEQFRLHDAAADRKAVLAQIRATLNRRRYIRNLMHEVDKEIEPR